MDTLRTLIEFGSGNGDFCVDQLTGISTFVKVLELASFSATAKQLCVSAAVVSNLIQLLEKRLNARLLNRRLVRTAALRRKPGDLLRMVPLPANREPTDTSAQPHKGTLRSRLEKHWMIHATSCL